MEVINNDKVFGFIKVLVILLLISGAVAWHIYRWKVFQDVTQTDIGYFKWLFLIDSK